MGAVSDHVGATRGPLSGYRAPRLESQEARRARMAEDHQLAQVLQDIEATERGIGWKNLVDID